MTPCASTRPSRVDLVTRLCSKSLHALSAFTLKAAIPIALGLGLSSNAQAQSTSTQRALAWGNNQSGQLGDGTTTNRSLAINITDQGALKGKTVVELAGGDQFSLAVCSDGTLASWGQNSFGQLGDGTNTSRKIPTAITGLGGLRGKKVTQISAGYQHALALCADGTVASWGWNPYGQLGDGTTVSKNLPVNITGKGVLKGRKVTRVVAGANHNFALCADGTLAAWGSNSGGQLGDGSTANYQFAPVDITNKGVLAGKTVTQITAGSEHTLALLSNGGVGAWGRNPNGQLGNNTHTDANLPVGITNWVYQGSQSITQLIAAGSHSFAVFNNGTIAAWGRNRDAELGTGRPDDLIRPQVIGFYSVLENKNVIRLASGATHTIALCSDGSVAGWGNNTAGQLGPNISGLVYSPIDITEQGDLRGKTLTFIAAGSNHNLALGTVNEAPTIKVLSPTANQQLLLADFNGDTIRGDATDNVGIANVQIKLFRTRNGVDQFWNGTAFTTTSAAVEAQLSGNGTNVTWKMGAKTPPQSSLDAGLYQLLVSVTDTENHRVNAPLRQFSLFPPDTEKPKVFISFPQPNQRLLISQVAGGIINGDVSDNMAISYKNVQVKLYRTRNGVNQVWNGTSFTTNVTTVDADSNGFYTQNLNYWKLQSKAPPASQLDEGQYQIIVYATDASGNTGSARATFTLVASSTIRVLGWGYNGLGQLGNGKTGNQFTPIDISHLGALLGKEVVKLAVGEGHTLALCDDGTLLAWGADNSGQRGDGATDSQGLPVNISGQGALKGKTVTQISAAGSKSLALCSDGTLVAWGYLPGNGTQQSDVPVNITGQGALKGKTAVQIDTSFYHSIVLCSDGTVVTWGDSESSPLGDGSTAVRTTPISITNQGVLAGKRVTKIFIGGSSYALCSDGTLAVWGNNDYGQLGDGTTTQRTLPTALTNRGALGGKTISTIEPNFFHTVALCSDGTVATWGLSGLVGEDTSGNFRTTPNAINNSGAMRGKTVTQISAGYNHSLALCSDGTALGWGANDSGQIYGNKSAPETRIPIVINSSGALRGKDLRQLAAGSSFSEALGTLSEKPTIQILSPKTNDIINITLFDGDTINGDATDDQKVTSVRVRLYRTRNGVTEYWNGTSFTPHRPPVPAEISTRRSGTATFVEWKLGDKTPPQRLLDGGEYTVVASANDAQGHSASAIAVFNLRTPDNVKPQVTIKTPSENQQVSIEDFASGAVPISGTASDDQAIDRVLVRIVRVRNGITRFWDGTQFTRIATAIETELSGPNSGNWALTKKLPPASALDAGAYTLYAFAYDTMGNDQVHATSLPDSHSPVQLRHGGFDRWRFNQCWALVRAHSDHQTEVKTPQAHFS